METIEGISASPGRAVGPAFLYEKEELEVKRRSGQDPGREWERLGRALERARSELAELEARTAEEAGSEEAAIFEAHAMFLEDPALLQATEETLKEEGINAEAAWLDAIEGYAAQLQALEDEYMQARAADVRDVGERVLRQLMGAGEADLSGLNQPAVIVAADLTPSDTAGLEPSLVLGFCTAEGGPTSHAAILARALGKPAVVGAGRPVLAIETGEPLLVDGSEGTIIRAADAETRRRFSRRADAAAQRRQEEREAAQAPAQTAEGERIEVVANVGSLADAKLALENGAEGIGLLRTEFLFLDRQTAPDEEEQRAALEPIFDLMGERPIVVRTLDVGGDKPLAYLDMPAETNPFLGWRAIRLSLDRPDLFLTQLRALLRAGAGRDLRIMFPMVASLEEARRAKELVVEASSQLEDAGLTHCTSPQVGIMVEVPATVQLADQFAEEVDFFSIGTNDLTQYTFAAERANRRVAHLSDAAHPAVLRQIAHVIEAGHQAGLWVGLCGELAGDETLIPVLLGLGLDEFSMSPPFIPRAKSGLRQWTMEAAHELAAAALGCSSAEAVRALVRERS